MLNARALVSRAPCFRGEHSISSRVWSDISRLSQSRSSTTFIRISESRLHTFVLCIYPAGRSLLDSWLKDTMRLSGWKSIVAFLSFALLCAACTPEQNNPNGSKTGGDDSHSDAPAVTVGVDKLSAISVVLKGKANLPASVAADLKIGFQYSQSAGILPTNSTTVDAEDADADYYYTTGITGLDPETTYYFRSLVRQNGVDTYGETQSFTTKELSSLLATQDATEIEATSVILNGTLDFTNLSLAYKSIEYGFFWGTSESSQPTKLSVGSIADNTYSASLHNLSHKTQYWYKAYVKLDDQTFYGEVKTFTTDVIPVESVTLDKTEHSFNTIGNTLAMTATVLPSDATDRGVEWSSDNADVATVDQNGVVTANGNGDAVITVTTKDKGKTATCAITVVQFVTSISLDQTSLSLYEGEDYTLAATVKPDNAANKLPKWTSSNESVATVNQAGKVTAVSKGTATIKAEAQDGSGKYASCSLTVKETYTAVAPEAVDLGIVVNGKNIKWGSFNLGATKPEEHGDYFAWGETAPKEDYSLNYKWCNDSLSALTKYNTSSSYGTVDNKTVLDPEDDAAHVALGGKWRIPTDAEWTALRNNCTWTWTSNYNGTGVAGRIVTSNVEGYTDKSIFLPAAGFRENTNLYIARSDGYYGYYWSSSLDTDRPYDAWKECFGPRDLYMDHSHRYVGLSIRPVTE